MPHIIWIVTSVKVSVEIRKAEPKNYIFVVTWSSMSRTNKTQFSFASSSFVCLYVNENFPPNLIAGLVTLDFRELMNGHGVEELIGHEHRKTAAGNCTQVCVPFNLRTVFCMGCVGRQKMFWNVVKWALLYSRVSLTAGPWPDNEYFVLYSLLD
jgi:hypothetical protein